VESLWKPSVAWWQLGVRAAVVYVAVLLMLRLAGKRQVGQMGTAQFVALLLVSNAVQNSLNGGDNSLAGGLVLAAILMVLSYVFSVLTYASKDWESFIEGRPTLLMHRGKLLPANLRKELLTLREFKVLMRKQGLHNLNEVEEAVLESDGFISVVRKAEHPEVEESHARDA